MQKIKDTFLKVGFILLLLAFGILLACCLFDLENKKVIALFFALFGTIYWGLVTLLNKIDEE